MGVCTLSLCWWKDTNPNPKHFLFGFCFLQFLNSLMFQNIEVHSQKFEMSILRHMKYFGIFSMFSQLCFSCKLHSCFPFSYYQCKCFLANWIRGLLLLDGWYMMVCFKYDTSSFLQVSALQKVLGWCFRF